MKGQPAADPLEVLEALRRELQPVEQAIRSHRYLEGLETGRVTESGLRVFAGEQYSILRSDRRSFAHLASRFPESPAGEFFLDLAQGEGEALVLLLAFARAVGLDEEGLRAHEPMAGSQAYPAFVAWLALNGSRTDLALALLANLAAWGANCARMAEALRGRLELEDEAVAFFDFFATPPPDFEERALAVAADALGAGDSPEHARRAAHRLQAYELLYWDTLARDV